MHEVTKIQNPMYRIKIAFDEKLFQTQIQGRKSINFVSEALMTFVHIQTVALVMKLHNEQKKFLSKFNASQLAKAQRSYHHTNLAHHHTNLCGY